LLADERKSCTPRPAHGDELDTLRTVPDDGLNGETTKQRVDRELSELLGELRIALPGVQMLFAFLLTVPFYARFETLPGLFRAVFFVAFICTTIAAVFMIAPSSNHRISFRARDKERLLLRANRFAIVGIAFLAVAMCGVVFFIAGMVVGDAWAPVAAGGTGALILATWYIWPLIRKLGNSARA
jgi:hypothetical protein